MTGAIRGSPLISVVVDFLSGEVPGFDCDSLAPRSTHASSLANHVDPGSK